MRLAIRNEGEWVVAYIAEPRTLEGAIELARILRTVAGREVVFDAWTETLRVALSTLLTEEGVDVREWRIERAPEHERSGRA